MGAILNIKNRFAAIVKKLFRRAEAVRVINEHEAMVKVVTEAENAIYKSIIIQMKNDPDIVKHGAEVRLLQRRLEQYERMRNHASLNDQEMALRKLEKQWKKVESISHRKRNHDNNLKSFNGDFGKLNPRSVP